MAGDFEDFGGGQPGSSPDPNEAGFGTPSEDDSVGKHALIMVPDFTNTSEAATPGGNALNSYLRLGAAHSQAGPAVTQDMVDAYNKGNIQLPPGCGPLQLHGLRADLGEDLAALVLGFTDDIRDRGTTQTAPQAAPDTAVPASGFAEPAPIGQTAIAVDTPDAGQQGNQGDTFRLNESARLHNKGGWRDHSDGNRITTTRGDKVEVIRGNYKLLVLGRTDDVDNAVGFDMSGGQVDTDSGDLAHPTAAELNQQAMGTQVQGLDVTWQWVDSDSDGKGRWHVTTNQGSLNPIQTGGLPGQPASGTASNPTMTTNTFAFDVTSNTTAHTSTTNVTTDQDNNNTTTSNNGSVHNRTSAMSGTISNESESIAQANRNYAAVNIFNELASPLQETTQQIGVNLLVNAIGADIQGEAAGALIVAQLTGANILQQTSGIILTDQLAATVTTIQTATNINVAQQALNINNIVTAPVITTTTNGVAVDNHTGAHVDNHLLSHVDNHPGLHLDLHGGVHIQMDLGPEKLTMSEAEVKQVMGNDFKITTMSLKCAQAEVVTVATSMIHM